MVLSKPLYLKQRVKRNPWEVRSDGFFCLQPFRAHSPPALRNVKGMVTKSKKEYLPAKYIREVSMPSKAKKFHSFIVYKKWNKTKSYILYLHDFEFRTVPSECLQHYIITFEAKLDIISEKNAPLTKFTWCKVAKTFQGAKNLLAKKLELSRRLRPVFVSSSVSPRPESGSRPEKKQKLAPPPVASPPSVSSASQKWDIESILKDEGTKVLVQYTNTIATPQKSKELLRVWKGEIVGNATSIDGEEKAIIRWKPMLQDKNQVLADIGTEMFSTLLQQNTK